MLSFRIDIPADGDESQEEYPGTQGGANDTWSETGR